MANLLIIKATKDSKNGKGISKDFSSCYRETSCSIYLGLGLRFGFLGCFVGFFFFMWILLFNMYLLVFCHTRSLISLGSARGSIIT